MLNIINTLLAAASLVFAILDYIKNNYKGTTKYIHKTQIVYKETTVIGIPCDHEAAAPASIPAKYIRHYSIIAFAFTALCVFCMIYFSVKPIAPTIALVHILTVVIFTHFCIFVSSSSVGIPIKHYLLYIASIIALIAILVYFSFSSDAVPFFSHEINKAYLYFVMIVPLVIFAYQSNWLIRVSKGFLVDDERFVFTAEVIVFLGLLLTGAFEWIVTTAGSAFFALLDRFFSL